MTIKWNEKYPFRLYQNELEDGKTYKNVRFTLKDGKRIDVNLILLLLPCNFFKEILKSCEDSSDFHIIIPDIELNDFERMIELLVKGEAKWNPNDGLLELVYDMLGFDENVFSLEEKKVHSKTKKEIKYSRRTFLVTESNSCKFCLKYFPRLDQLKAHVLSNHSSKPVQNTNLDNENKKNHERSHKDKTKFVCPKCGKSYSTYNNLWRHCKQKKHKYPGKGVYPKYEKVEKTGHIRCDICHRMVGRLAHHKKKHHSEESRNFSCDMCDFKTDRSDYFAKHLLLKHNMISRDFQAIDKTFENKEIEWRCYDCKRSFNSAVEIEDHILLKNCEELICKICKRKFKEKSNLVQHIKNIHENPQKFHCENCTKSFSYKSSLYKHKKKCN